MQTGMLFASECEWQTAQDGMLEGAYKGDRFRAAGDSDQWLQIEALEPYLDRVQGVGTLNTRSWNALLPWSSVTGRDDSVVWLPESSQPDADILLGIRVNGGVTVQLKRSSDFGPHDWPCVKRALEQAVGSLDVRRRWAQSMRDAIDACECIGMPETFHGNVMGCLGRSDHKASCDKNWPLVPRIEVLRRMVPLSLDIEKKMQTRVAQAVAVAKFRCTRARRVIRKHVRKNMRSIKERLWRPDGLLVYRSLQEALSDG